MGRGDHAILSTALLGVTSLFLPLLSGQIKVEYLWWDQLHSLLEVCKYHPVFRTQIRETESWRGSVTPGDGKFQMLALPLFLRDSPKVL